MGIITGARVKRALRYLIAAWITTWAEGVQVLGWEGGAYQKSKGGRHSCSTLARPTPLNIGSGQELAVQCFVAFLRPLPSPTFFFFNFLSKLAYGKVTLLTA